MQTNTHRHLVDSPKSLRTSVHNFLKKIKNYKTGTPLSFFLKPSKSCRKSKKSVPMLTGETGAASELKRVTIRTNIEPREVNHTPGLQTHQNWSNSPKSLLGRGPGGTLLSPQLMSQPLFWLWTKRVRMTVTHLSGSQRRCFQASSQLVQVIWGSLSTLVLWTFYKKDSGSEILKKKRNWVTVNHNMFSSWAPLQHFGKGKWILARVHASSGTLLRVTTNNHRHHHSDV